MKVGDYVRTKYGISQCIRVIPIRENSFMYEFDKEVYEEVNYLTASELEKYKTSPNIIDLIEVGDFITYRQGNIYWNIPERVSGRYNRQNEQTDLIVNGTPLEHLEILSIVTKEQFEEMEYKL